MAFTLKPYKKLKSTLKLLGLRWNYCSDTGTIVRFIHRFVRFCTKLCTYFDSYPQVYPQINLTDNIIRHPRSGVMWSIVENGAYHRSRRNVKRVFLALSQTFKPVKPYIPIASIRMISQL